jgi:DNA polymerase III delta prime subunit
VTEQSWPPVAWPPNPFDYSNAAKPESFAARRKEVKLVQRFINAVSKGEAAHLLISGPRSLGKSSLLGKARTLLDEAGIIHGTVVLDAGSAAEREFLQETTLALQHAVLAAGGFDGAEGAFEGALSRALLGQASTDQYPLRVASFLAATRTAPAPVRVPDELVRLDLANLVDEASELGSSGLVLMIDEANYLGGHPTTVQRLRNLILVAPGLSVVLAGTDEVLAAFDEALSPAARHFHKMQLPPLGDVSETFDLVATSLQSVGLPAAIVLPSDLPEEIHLLAGGNPYEVALLCHVMYDHMTRAGEHHMSLSDAVIEEAAAQLRPSGTDAVLPILRGLDGPDIERAARYCVDPAMTLHEHALLRLAFSEPGPDSVQAARAAVKGEWGELERQGLAIIDGEFIVPQLGEFGRIYLKYHARVTGDLPADAEGTFSDRLARRLVDRVEATVKTIDGVEVVAVLRRSDAALVSGREESVSADFEDLRAGRLDDLADRFSLISVLSILEKPASEDSDLELVAVPFEIREDGFVALLVLGVAAGSDRTSTVDGAIRSVFDVPGPYRVRLGEIETAKVSASQWRTLSVAFRSTTTIIVVALMWSKGERQAASGAAREGLSTLAELGNVAVLPRSALQLLNNAGFVELVAGHLVEALSLLERCAAAGGLTDERDEEQRVLLLCNLAAANAGLGNYRAAIDWASDARATRLSARSSGWSCVYQPFPDWPKSPRMVAHPDLAAIARGTQIGARAMLADTDALNAAGELVEEFPERWAYELLGHVARSIGNDARADEALYRASQSSDAPARTEPEPD